MLSDPTGATCSLYGALAPSGAVKRMAALIDADGKVEWVDESVGDAVSVVGQTATSRYGEDLKVLFGDWRAKLGAKIPRLMGAGPDGRSRTWTPYTSHASVLWFPDRISAESEREVAALRKVYRDVAFVSVGPTGRVRTVDLRLAEDTWNRLAPGKGVEAIVVDAQGTVQFVGDAFSINSKGIRTSRVRHALNRLLIR
ncbi:MAG: hypothetical protein HONBIEJF_00342 [Fimbriimonadaceae bacterium]|nr:hypothetical protein [Fimbriimonadaceae bacterium]